MFFYYVDVIQVVWSFRCTVLMFYRWYGGVGLTSIVLLVVLLQILGLGFGTCSQNSDTRPTERGCVGTSAGNMLMA